MAYSRLYTMAVGSYAPSANPLYKQSNTVTATDGSGNITTVSATLVALVITPSEWYCNIVSGPNASICVTYQISATPTATSFTLLNMDGTAWTAPVGSTASNYSIQIFKNTGPSENEAIPSAFCCDTPPSTALEIITGDGQYFAIPAATIVAGAVYGIIIREIVDLDGAVGYLLAERGYSSNIR